MMIHEVSVANVICSRPLIVPRLQKQRGIQDFLSQTTTTTPQQPFFWEHTYMAGKYNRLPRTCFTRNSPKRSGRMTTDEESKPS
jgi:hypothetical protein